MIPFVSPPQNNNNQPSNTITYQLDEAQLNSIVTDYYLSINSTHSNNRIDKMVQQHGKVQQEIIEIVQMRKEMEKVYEIQLLQAQNFTTIEQLVNQNLQAQKVIEELQGTIKRLEEQNINNIAEKLQQYLKIITPYNQYQAANAIKMGISEIGGFGLGHLFPDKGSDDNWIGSLSQLEEKQGESQLHRLFEQQSEKYELFKRVYSSKFREVMLREQMVSEREQAFGQYSQSNHQLIEALLREKERDKNLSKIERQKLEEQFKARHRIQLETQNMKHHQNNLVAYYEVELERLSNRNREIEGGREAEMVRLRKEVQNLRESYESKLKNCHSQMNDLRKKIEQLSGQLQNGKHQGESKAATLIQQNRSLALKLSAAVKQNKQLVEKMQSLQSHLNQTVLKLSQANRNKQQLSVRLEEAVKKQGELQHSVSLLRAGLEAVTRQRHQIQQRNKQLQTHSSILQENYTLSKTEISLLQSKITALQNELTDAFIKTNSEFKKLQQDIQNRDDKIDKLLKEKIEFTKLLELKQQELQNSQESATQLQQTDLKESIRAELQRQSQRKQKLLDEAILKISELIC